jgi:hypothetical protein
VAIDRLGVVPRLAALRWEIGRRHLRDHYAMSYRAVCLDEFEWTTRPHEAGEPARHVAELSDAAGFSQVRGNV